MLLGQVLKHIRVFNSYTQLEMAKNLGISRSYISEIESNNKTPTIEILQKYSDVFNIPLSTIMLFAEEYKNKKGLRKKAKFLLAKTAIDFLDWICKEDEKRYKIYKYKVGDKVKFKIILSTNEGVREERYVKKHIFRGDSITIHRQYNEYIVNNLTYRRPVPEKDIIKKI